MVTFHLAFPTSDIALLSTLGASLMVVIGLLLRSQLGYGLAIYGNNPQFFSHHNISGSYVVSFGIILGHGLAGISGFLFAHANGFVDLGMNFGVILLCLTSLMLGKLFLTNKNPTI